MSYKSGEARYAIKFLRRGITHDRKQFNMAVEDFKTEAEIISRLNHPNIIKIRGAAIGGSEAYLRPGGRHDSHFLLLDRLNGTLDQQIEDWKKLNHVGGEAFLQNDPRATQGAGCQKRPST
jgi:serine/threonine protein kinase